MNIQYWLLLAALMLFTNDGESYPENEYVYSLTRDELLEAETAFEGERPVLSENEKVVDHYLYWLKLQEHQDTVETGFPPSRPIEEQMDIIIESPLYKALLNMPKGGNMHSHENHEVSKRTLLQIVFDSPDFKYLWIKSNESATDPLQLDFFINPPSDEIDEWTKVSETGHTVDSLFQMSNLISVLSDKAKKYPTDSGLRWTDMNPLWGRGSTQLIANVNIKREYLKALYNQSLSNGVQYLETRKNFGAAEMLYMLDPSSSTGTGKVYLDNKEGALEINITTEILDEFIKDNPSFIGHKRIVYSVRVLPDFVEEDINRVLNLHEQYPRHIVGYDMVAEEDQGYALLYHLDNFLSLYDSNTKESKIPLYLHTAETNWPGDIITHTRLDDPVATAKNAFDAIQLGAKRVGHGLGFAKFPYLLQVIKNKSIAVEVCPVSNQLLGFVPDLRNHPAQLYFKSGVPIVLGADDPGSFGYDHFNIDWYEIFMAWGLNLADLKKLAQNSIEYSAMNAGEKESAHIKFYSAWNSYITTMKSEACEIDFTESTPTFSMLLPKKGAITGTTNVHIFGRHFEKAICKTIRCRFGDVLSEKALYISSNHIMCEAPSAKTYINNIPLGGSFDTSLLESEVYVHIDLGDGDWRQLDQTFEYKYSTGDYSSATHIKYSGLSTTLLFIFFLFCNRCLT